MSRCAVDLGLGTTDAVGSWCAGRSVSVPSGDPEATLRDAVLRLLESHPAPPGPIELMATGVGSHRLPASVEDWPISRVDEIDAIGKGGLVTAKVESALVVSMGTGTAFVSAGPDGFQRITPGTGVGGGTLRGFAALLPGRPDAEAFEQMALRGDRSRLDWSVGEVFGPEGWGGLPTSATISNLGKHGSSEPVDDLAAALTNLVFEVTLAMTLLALQLCGRERVVLIGKLAALRFFQKRLDEIPPGLRGMFLIPAQAAVATAIGALATRGDQP